VAEDQDPVREQDRLFDAVGHHEDRPGRHLLADPELHELVAKLLRGEHVQGREGLVHEQDFRLDD